MDKTMRSKAFIVVMLLELLLLCSNQPEMARLQRQAALRQHFQGNILQIFPTHQRQIRRKYHKKLMWRKKRGADWWNEVVKRHFKNDDFIANFRVSIKTFNMLHSRLKPYFIPKENYVTEPMKIDKKIAIALYKLSCCAEYRVVANQFSTHKTTVHNILYTFCEAMLVELKEEYLSLPNSEEAKEISDAFERMCNIPNILGAIDGTHFPILPPDVGRRDFVNRKGWASYNVLAVVDHMYRFRYATCKHPGSAHDAKVLKDSTLFNFVDRLLPQDTRIVDNVSLGYFILGDPAYPLLKWLIKPFKGNITREEESFNVYLSRDRVVVEKAFGRLKARFRILLKRIDIHYKFVPKVIITCLILHNIVEMNKDKFLQQWIDDVEKAAIMFPQPQKINSRESDYLEGGQIRNFLKNYMLKFPLKRSKLL